jgi:guanosine-3',5'-bis(diphosphate) 3'-pyrophosphohydrolase
MSMSGDAMLDLETHAAMFATEMHAGQVRKYTFAPYITHCRAVAGLVRTVPHTSEMLAAAWLHDTVEDCAGVTVARIQALFGDTVARYVEQLTDVSRPKDGNREARKALDRAHLAGADAQVKTIKLADLIDNSRSIVAYDEGFARVYIREKALLLEVLREGDQTLWVLAREIVVEATRELSL